MVLGLIQQQTQLAAVGLDLIGYILIANHLHIDVRILCKVLGRNVVIRAGQAGEVELLGQLDDQDVLLSVIRNRIVFIDNDLQILSIREEPLLVDGLTVRVFCRIAQILFVKGNAQRIGIGVRTQQAHRGRRIQQVQSTLGINGALLLLREGQIGGVEFFGGLGRSALLLLREGEELLHSGKGVDPGLKVVHRVGRRRSKGRRLEGAHCRRDIHRLFRRSFLGGLILVLSGLGGILLRHYVGRSFVLVVVVVVSGGHGRVLPLSGNVLFRVRLLALLTVGGNSTGSAVVCIRDGIGAHTGNFAQQKSDHQKQGQNTADSAHLLISHRSSPPFL